jgi:hypothetical protein
MMKSKVAKITNQLSEKILCGGTEADWLIAYVMSYFSDTVCRSDDPFLNRLFGPGFDAFLKVNDITAIKWSTQIKETF